LRFIRLCFNEKHWFGEKLPPTEPLEKLVGKDLPPLHVGERIQPAPPGHHQQPQQPQQPHQPPHQPNQPGHDWDPFFTPGPTTQPQQPPKQPTFDPFAPPPTVQTLQPQQGPLIGLGADQRSLLGAPTGTTGLGATGGNGLSAPTNGGTGGSSGFTGASVGTSLFGPGPGSAAPPRLGSDSPSMNLTGSNLGGPTGTGVAGGFGTGLNVGTLAGTGAGAGAGTMNGSGASAGVGTMNGTGAGTGVGTMTGTGAYGGGVYGMAPGMTASGWPQYGMMMPGGMMHPGMMMIHPGMMMMMPGSGAPMTGGWGVSPSQPAPTSQPTTSITTPKPDPFADLSLEFGNRANGL